ncbi:MAG: hypothetical protein H0X29_02490 [Parachlamydiaceae bacterium]|nr:hypothetical protein [Parachlamydiaceae bacterium]
MKQLNGNGESEFLLTLSDLGSVLKKKRYTIFKMALLGAFLALSYGLSQPIEYRVEATFKEKGKSQSGLNQSLSALLLNADANESEALTMMRSRMLIENLVISQGLQAEIKKKETSFPFPFKRIKDNFLSEYAHNKNLNSPLIKPFDQQIKAEKINYDGQVPIELSVVFYSHVDFDIETDGQILGQGKLGIPFTSDHFSFTLQKKSPSGISGKQYRLILKPLSLTAQTIAKKFTVEPDRFDNSLLKIAYQHPDKYQAVDHTTALMELYKEHNYQEHQRVCNLQITYLQEKQADMGKQLETLMRAHANNLSSDLSDTGFADYTSAMTFLTSNQQNYKQRLEGIDLEIHWLNQLLITGKAEFDKFTSTQNPDFINQLTKEIRRLKQEVHSLQLALGKYAPEEELSSQDSIKNFLGIDLNTAKELYLAYSKELNALEAEEAQFHFLTNQITLPGFEISSLSSVLSDPISLEMISKASPLILALKDQDNSTQKEQERLKMGLAVQKNFFTTHLAQTIQLIQLRQQLMKEKIQTLQNAHLALILEQISILENQMADYITRRLSVLEHEKDLYDHNLVNLRAEMASLPQKWVAEQMIQQKMEINQNMIEQISKLVESKNLASNLERTQSTSVDLPIIPLHPKPPRLLLLTLMGTLAGTFLSIGWVLAKSIGKGVKASTDNLRLAGQHVSGTLSLQKAFSNAPSTASNLLDSDLDTLRRIISFITSSDSISNIRDNENTLLLLCNSGPKYGEMLAELMSKMGFKTLILDLCFTAQNDEMHEPGLLQYFNENPIKLHIQHKASYDIIFGGGITRFANEVYASERFKKIIYDLKSDYDWIIAINCASPLSAEAETLLKQFSKAIITINDESLQELRLGVFQLSIPKSFVIIVD